MSQCSPMYPGVQSHLIQQGDKVSNLTEPKDHEEPCISSGQNSNISIWKLIYNSLVLPIDGCLRNRIGCMGGMAVLLEVRGKINSLMIGASYTQIQRSHCTKVSPPLLYTLPSLLFLSLCCLQHPHFLFFLIPLSNWMMTVLCVNLQRGF